MLSFLNTLAEKEKGKTIKILNDASITPNKVVFSTIYVYSLNEAHSQWVLDTYFTIRDILERIPVYGQIIKKTFQTITIHEKNWLKWKNSSCPQFERDPIDFSLGVKRAVKRSSEAIHVPGTKKFMGSKGISELWDIGKDLDKELAQKSLEYFQN